MGTYLSTPVTEKGKEEGESLHCPMTPVAWGVVDMQGWRKSMEDAHVARTDVYIPKHLLQQMMQKQQQEQQTQKEKQEAEGDAGGGGDTAVSSALPQNVDAKVFGVFDGHGGPEVARFCQLYLVSVLQHQPTWSERHAPRYPLPRSATDCITVNEMSHDYRQDSDIGRALRMCFHSLDRLIDHPSRREELVRLRAIKPQPGERREIDDADQIPPPAEFVGGPPIQISSCHDDDENETPATPAAAVAAADVEEDTAATRNSSNVTTAGVADDSSPSSSAKDFEGVNTSSGNDDDIATAASESTAASTEKETGGSDGSSSSSTTSAGEETSPSQNDQEGQEVSVVPSSPTLSATTTTPSENKEGDESMENADSDKATEAKMKESNDVPEAEDKNNSQNSDDDAGAASSPDSSDDEDSEQAAGVEEAALLDRDLMNDDEDDDVNDENDVNDGGDKDENDIDDGDDDEGAIGQTPLPALPAVPAVVESSSPPSISTTTAGKVSTMFQRLLNLSGTSPAVASGQFAAVLSGSIGGSSSSRSTAAEGTSGDTGILPPPPPPPPPPPLPPSGGGSPGGGPCASLPTIVQNGRMICNLPEHPIHAGATAIVAVICGKTLTVANAGDSRAVLCRGSGGSNGAGHQTLALSFDHKPQQEVEMNRIHRAGGFINHFGRVNGNLNLSRSIGDLKYKQVPGIRPADQMISAEPDIIEIQLRDDDEFIILGCDGIWDCLSNSQAVDYVLRRIHSQTPTEIGVEMLDEILSTDPRVTQGIGGDNMTIMIIDLQPHSRSYRKTSSSSSRYRRGGSHHHRQEEDGSGDSNGGQSQNSDCDDSSPVL